MSGLSMADMRRLGEQRNQPLVTSEPKSSSVLKKLPFMGGSAKPKASEAARVSAVVERQGHAQAVPIAPPIAAETLNDKQAAKPLRIHEMRHAALGAGLGAVVGVGATGALLAVPAGAVFGGLAGSVLSKRSYALASQKRKTVALTAKAAPRLFHALSIAADAQGYNKAKFSVATARTATLEVTDFNAKSQRFSITIGFALLHALSSFQLSVLCSQVLSAKRMGEESDVVDGGTVRKLQRLEQSLVARSAMLRFQNLETLHTTGQQAEPAWAGPETQYQHQADRDAAAFAGAPSLVDALLAQALTAAMFAPHLGDDAAYDQTLANMRRGWPQATLNAALKTVASTPSPSAHMVANGLPLALVERIKALDTTCPVPTLPAHEPAFQGLSEKAQRALAKTFGGEKPKRSKEKKAKKTKTNKIKDTAHNAPGEEGFVFGGTPQPLAQAMPISAPEMALEAAPETERIPSPLNRLMPTRHDTPQAPQAAEIGLERNASKQKPAKRSLLAGLFSGKKGAKAARPVTQLGQEPLYNADQIYKSDAALGIEAYQALVDAHPRWALARLRLGESLVENGYADGVAHLVASAQALPSALPSILETLQGALAMVSPLDEEPLRNSIVEMARNASDVAAERSEIDLIGLGAPIFDAEDRATLEQVFASFTGLREVWAFGAPCVGMPDVPHHALIGLAPRVNGEDAELMALSLAEHAAIAGTVAVHIETGTPSGPLSDALASQPSMWRADAV